MTQHDPQPTPESEREALAMLVARFSADRDALASAIQRCESQVSDLAARVETATAPQEGVLAAAALDPLRAQVERLGELVAELDERLRQLWADVEARDAERPAEVGAPLVAAVDDLRAELGRLHAVVAREVAGEVERASAAALAAVASERLAAGAALEALRGEVAGALDEVRRSAASGGERAAGALTQIGDVERRVREIETMRPMLQQLRDDLLRRVEETEVRLGVRLDAIVAGAEAENRTTRDAVWDRLAVVEQLAHAADEAQSAGRSEAAQAEERVATLLASVRDEMEGLRVELLAGGERLLAVEEAQQQTRHGGMLACVRDEIVAAVMMLASLGAVAARLPAWLGR